MSPGTKCVSNAADLALKVCPMLRRVTKSMSYARVNSLTWEFTLIW